MLKESSERNTIAAFLLVADQLQGILVASKLVSRADGEQTSLEAVTLLAKKATSRTYGDVIVAIVQSDRVIATQSTDASDIEVIPGHVAAQFGSIGQIAGNFEALVLFYGAGLVMISDLEVVGTSSFIAAQAARTAAITQASFLNCPQGLELCGLAYPTA